MNLDLSQLLEAIQFKNNPALRPCKVDIPYTDDMAAEILRCEDDPIYFIKNYIKVVHPDRGIVLMDLYDYQERMINTYHSNKKVIFLTARQQGKCFCINTMVTVRNKSTGEKYEITIGDFYKWQAFKKVVKDAEIHSQQISQQ